MKEDKYFEEKISRALEAIKHPENFTDEELRKLLNDTKGSVVILGGLTFVNFPLCIHLC